MMCYDQSQDTAPPHRQTPQSSSSSSIISSSSNRPRSLTLGVTETEMMFSALCSFSAAKPHLLDFPLYILLTFSQAYASEDPQDVNGKPGENVTLHCVVPTQAPIEVLKWVRPDLKSDGFVLFYRDKVIKTSYQHPSFVDRVELRDPEMKDGDVTVILRNVSINDTGRYEGHVSVSSSGRKRRAHSELRCIINLNIKDSGEFIQLHPLVSNDGGKGSDVLPSVTSRWQQILDQHCELHLDNICTDVVSCSGSRPRQDNKFMSLKINDDPHDDTWFGQIAAFLRLEENLTVYSVAAVFILIFLTGTSYVVINRCRARRHSVLQTEMATLAPDLTEGTPSQQGWGEGEEHV
ncbi:uncharacterized protein [Trachinotus anak]|uniref:uncharacterized protein isoform X1 n=1 Tax=Trachinotus anak TaxID=443729 RepID=UPI0039F17F9D